METSLCLKQTEIGCAEQIPSLAAWVIEYAWSHRMMDVLEGLLPCMRQDGELRSLTLEEPCALRVAAAQAWSVVNTRDIEQFESVLELLESIYTLVPRLVPAIKHVKIMFGLKTMIVMWMLQKNHGEVGTMTKIVHFFPSRLSLYRGCSKRELDVMRRSHCEFKQLAQTLLFHKEVRKAYIRDQMEDQYGERYAQKLEERLFDYLQLLERDLPPTTCIDQVLRQERPLVEGEQLLLEVLSCSPRCVSAALRRLYCAKAMLCTGPGTRQPTTCTDKEQQTPPPLAGPKDSAKRTAPPAERVGRVRSSMSHGSRKGCGEEKATATPLCSMWSCVGGGSDGAEQRLRKQGLSLGGCSHGTRRHGHEERGLDQDERGWGQEEKGQGQEERSWGQGKKRQSWGRTKLAEKHCQMGEYPMQLCSRHKKWVRNILQECSVELGGQSVSILKEYPKELGQSMGIFEQYPEEVRGESVNIMEQCPKEVGCETVNILEQCPKEVGGQSVNILEQCSKEVGCQTVNILEQCPKEVGGQSVNILEQCSKEVGCQTVNILEQCPKKVGGQSVNILEQCSKEVGCQTVNILEQCPKEVGGQSVNILEQCSKEVGCQTVNILEQCPKEVGGQSVNILEQCSKEVRCQTVNILEQCPKEVGGQSVNILEQCSKEVGCQTLNILEQSPEEAGGQTVNILEQSPEEAGGQTVNILEQWPEEVEGQSMSILEQCSQEMLGQSVRALEECSEAMRSNQGAIELQQVLPLTSPHPVTPPHQFHTPRSYQGRGRDTTSSLASAERVGLRVGISLESQLVMMRSQMLQPTVQVRRLTQRECDQATGRTKITPDEEEEQGQESDESEEEGESDSWESDFSYSELDSSSDPNYNPF